ncbi:cellulose synthase complex periplasmic endoglucanase BcsZ [Diaphorobacter sp.]|uniref:cellulose synthase complex periplasmic endoglucanase BcsZ n=1 Tax=Diaphorobacter sp. TaxID=1934310 RepID=UPI0028A70483|nr:cellulose synthase complex periplasmic endoglucanase BcsZ [Diaphorobacter sp.]
MKQGTPHRKGPLQCLAIAGLSLGLMHAPAAEAAQAAADTCRAAAAWPLWEQFAARHMQRDGRVVDYSSPQQHSTSEGQSYSMLFALIARDRERFHKLWNWSIANLSGGKPGEHMPAWQWGRKEDGTWGVIDPNSASDANLWFAYALLEAARVWNEPRYDAQARTLLAQVAMQEVVDIPGLGPTLLPALKGFVLKEKSTWRLNPSYLPVPLARALEQADPGGPWTAVLASQMRMISETTPMGFAADWVAYDIPQGATKGAFVSDPVKGDIGSYDAIRTYLWAGMTPRTDKLYSTLKARLDGMENALRTSLVPPEKVQTTLGAPEGIGPVGFSAALLPYLKARYAKASLKTQQDRVTSQLLNSKAGAQPPYYDQVLGLFGTGWIEQRYQFLPNGRLQLRWEKACP